MKGRRRTVLVATEKISVIDKCKNSRPSNNLPSGSCSVALSSWKHTPHGVFSKITLYPHMLVSSESTDRQTLPPPPP